MIINSIKLANYKAYSGVCEFDFVEYNRDKPLYLVGGVNGAGKTSIIEALKLCLYGERSFRPNKHHKSYNKFLHSIHNYNARSEGREDYDFYLETNFTLFEVGHSQAFRVKRSWKVNAAKYSERFELFIDDEPFHLVNEHSWQEYIETLIPSGLADLVFFDSEEFRKIPSSLEAGFVPALMNFFEVDQLQSLVRDLDKYSISMIKDVDTDLHDTLQALDIERLEKKSELESLQNIFQTLQSEIKDKETDLLKIQRNLSKLSGKEASNVNTILARRDKILESSHTLNREYEEICSTGLPFALAPGLSKKLVKTLNEERSLKNKLANKLFIEKALVAVKARLVKNIETDQFELLANELKAEVGDTNGQLLHDVTESRSHECMAIFGLDLEYPVSTIYNIQRKLKKFRSELSSLNLDLREINSKGPHAKLFEELNDAKYGIRQLEEKVENDRLVVESIQVEIQKLADEYDKKKKLSDELVVLNYKKAKAQQASRIATKYMNYIVQHRFSKLREHFLEILDLLTTKTDLVTDIHFDPTIGSLQFLNATGEPLKHNNFSAGESEIIALALLWSVNKVSSKNMPIIIDSPLNRLDNKHREKFVEYFIKNSQSQIIMLSTDEEFRSIKDYGVDKLMSQSFTLIHKKKSKSTSIEPGYFNA
jgi:DNA sulfur modification protein DndD